MRDDSANLNQAKMNQAKMNQANEYGEEVTRERKILHRAIDRLQDKINRLEAEIADLRSNECFHILDTRVGDRERAWLERLKDAKEDARRLENGSGVIY